MSDPPGRTGWLQNLESLAKTVRHGVATVAILGAMVVAAWLFYRSGVEPEIPAGVADVCAELERAKSQAEGLCRAAFARLRDEPDAKARARTGRALYADAKAEHDGLVGWTAARLLVGFPDGDDGLSARSVGPREALCRLLAWCGPPGTINPPTGSAESKQADEHRSFGAGPPDLLAAAAAIDGRRVERRVRVVAELVKRLDACRWTEWEDLGPPESERPPIQRESMRPTWPASTPPASHSPAPVPPSAEAAPWNDDEPWLPECEEDGS